MPTSSVCGKENYGFQMFHSLALNDTGFESKNVLFYFEILLNYILQIRKGCDFLVDFFGMCVKWVFYEVFSGNVRMNRSLRKT